ncbi:MAG: helix-turn-helix domain-containing protein [Roseburia sp.]|nr:helix-turn-helix domain-containing protein [Anaeroplasma bactoclasticum]MCM1195532.1 helix-turn-helix domain-containing protein [Roseburia sp.]MCM1556910.1 helix-turn-helix domain-containing protein [Anaeroplasma bactoclasticum]
MTNKRLRELRLEKRMTLRELSEKLNISYSNIAMIERGERNLTADTAKIFSSFFSVSTDYLLGLTDERNATISSSIKDQLSDAQIAFYNHTENLTDEQMLDVIKYVEFLKSKENK